MAKANTKKTMGRPKKAEEKKTVNLSVTIPVNIREWVVAEAERTDRSVSRFVSLLLKECKERSEKK